MQYQLFTDACSVSRVVAALDCRCGYCGLILLRLCIGKSLTISPHCSSPYFQLHVQTLIYMLKRVTCDQAGKYIHLVRVVQEGNKIYTYVLCTKTRE